MKEIVRVISILMILAVLAGCGGGGSSDGGMLSPAIQTVDGDWEGTFTHPNVENPGNLSFSLTEDDDRIGGFYSISFRVRGSTRAGRGGGDASGSRNGEIVLRLRRVLVDGCDWIATMNQQSDVLTGTYTSTCNSNRGELSLRLVR